MELSFNITTIKLSPNALKVFKKRYLKKDENGNVVETPEDMFGRVARNIACADLIYEPDKDISKTEEEFYRIMASLEFLPNSPTLMNAGRDLQQLSACFVLPVEDSMESIFEAIKNTALIHKSGGGTGFSFSRVRPKNDVVQTTKGISSGPVSFMTVFDSATEAIKQGGTRRGANMGILRVDHPDILEFINVKASGSVMNNFNISVGLTREFMEALEKNLDYDLINPRTKKISGRLNSRKVFDLIVENAWKNGDPGIIFMDKLNEANPTPKLGEIESTNPCGEQPLLPYESCNLGSINLVKVVNNNSIDYNKLSYLVKTAVHFLDNVIDMNRYPLKKIEDMTKANRKIGLGVMGFADMLIRLGIPYNSEEAIAFSEEIMGFISKEARLASCELASKRGVFPNFKDSIYNNNGDLRLRNATTTTIAPTGTLSIIADCSSGIEPLFAISYTRNVLDNDELAEVHSYFKEVAEKEGFYSDELMREIAKRGSIKDFDIIPQRVRQVFVTAHDITPIWHIKMQAAFQRFTDNAVSKTVNFPHTATTKDVDEVYLLAYKLGCKGVTIYRDRSRDKQVLNIDNKQPKESYSRISPKPRPNITTGTTTKIGTGCGNLYIILNVDNEGQPFELFTQMGKAGGCAASQLEAIGRLVSLAFRSGIDIKSIIEQLSGIRCPSPSWEKGGRIFSCADAIARVIERQFIKSKTNVQDKPQTLDYPQPKNNNKFGNVVGVCPDCGSSLQHEEGCVVCYSCGFSKC
ncbi:MAG: vitamin B12-dependent ribonucleotide reductase [Candidatus Omnitrophica bacterium]|nr:vitamin B12-dependent ribonucleotide reductase [Candidatus Omnitrophota bacterium]